MNIYVAGPMRGRPEFNFPAFDAASKRLREQGHTVFAPNEKDIDRHDGVDISVGNLTGSIDQASSQHGFSLREALRDDMVWICEHADAIYLLDGWQDSKGAAAELALAEALGLEVIFEGELARGAKR